MTDGDGLGLEAKMMAALLTNSSMAQMGHFGDERIETLAGLAVRAAATLRRVSKEEQPPRGPSPTIIG